MSDSRTRRRRYTDRQAGTRVLIMLAALWGVTLLLNLVTWTWNDPGYTYSGMWMAWLLWERVDHDKTAGRPW